MYAKDGILYAILYDEEWVLHLVKVTSVMLGLGARVESVVWKVATSSTVQG